MLVINRLRAISGTHVQPGTALPSLCPAHLKGLSKTDRQPLQDAPLDSNAPADCLVIPVEGVNPHQRVRRGKGPSDANPPARIHGVFVDIDSYTWRETSFPDTDADCRPDALAQAIADAYTTRYRELASRGKSALSTEILPFPPQHVYRTPGRGVRLVWHFSEPVDVPMGITNDVSANQKSAFAFVERFYDEFVKLNGLAFGKEFGSRGARKPWLRKALASGLTDEVQLDECGRRATQPYALVTSERWAVVPAVSAAPSEPDLVRLTDKLQSALLRSTYLMCDTLGDGRNLSDVSALLEKKFGSLLPGIGNFPVGTKLPHFMDGQFNPLPSAPGPNMRACELREKGVAVHSTSGSLANGFYTWVQILHEDLEVQQLSSFADIANHYAVNCTTKTGSVATRVRPGFVWKLQGEWVSEIPEDALRQELVTEWKLSPKRKDGVPSQVDAAVKYIETHRQIVRESLAYFEEWELGPLRHWSREGDPGTYLEHNLAYRKFRVVPPATGPCDPDRDFPCIASWLRGFTDGHALNYLLAWLREPYILAQRRETSRGQVCMILGPRNSGKSFFFEEILYPAFHGGLSPSEAEAGAPSADFLVTGSQWTGAIADHFCLAIDDVGEAASESGKADARQRFATAIKAVSASGMVQANTKYGASKSVAFRGRILFLGNEEDAAAMIPADSESLNDKYILIRAQPIPEGRRLAPAEARSRFRAELPYFLSWLQDWTPPAACLPSAFGSVDKFGVRAYQDPDLVRHTRTGGRNATLMNQLEDFRTNLLQTAKEGETSVTLRLDALYAQVHGYLTAISALVNPRDFPSSHGFSIAIETISRQNAAELPWLALSTDGVGRRTAVISLDPNVPSRTAPQNILRDLFTLSTPLPSPVGDSLETSPVD